MAHTATHYETLEVKPQSTPTEIKQAYRRLAKQHHPDRSQSAQSQEAIKQINVAYETLSDPHSRRSYDQGLRYTTSYGAETEAGFATDSGFATARSSRDAEAEARYRKSRAAKSEIEDHVDRWLKEIYQPANRCLNQIIKPLRGQIKDLSADPFDDALMGTFMAYLELCRSTLAKAQTLLKKMPNPPTAATAAAHLYYSLNQVDDALDELESFTMNYDETYLHAGYEMFRIAEALRQDARESIRNF